MSRKDYEEMIRFLKREINVNGWNELDLSAEELMKLAEDKDVKACTEAMRECMLEGDTYLSDKRNTKETAVRYYCDNLSASRRKYTE